MEAKECTECEMSFIPKRKSGKQETCGAPRCVRAAKRRKWRAKQELRMQTKNKESNVLNADGTIKQYYLERGLVSSNSGQSVIGANL